MVLASKWGQPLVGQALGGVGPEWGAGLWVGQPLLGQAMMGQAMMEIGPWWGTLLVGWVLCGVGPHQVRVTHMR